MEMKQFLDIRNHGFRRVAIVVPPVHVANPKQNAEAHIAQLQSAYDDGAQYAICPELGLTAYSCGDLFHSETLIQGALKALETLVQKSNQWTDMVFSVGLPLRVDDMLFNCAATVLNGHVLGVAVKSYPPEYREFYEARYFHRATELRSREVELFGELTPIGTDILMCSEQDPLFKLHVDICEDIWVPIPPGTRAALAGATVLGNLSASNITIAKDEYREALVLASSARNNAVQLYSAAGFGESSTGHAWDGHGLVAERGSLLASTERYGLKGQHIVTDVDLLACVQERQRQSSFGQNAKDNEMSFRRVSFQEAINPKRAELFQEFCRDIDLSPAVPRDPAKRDVRCHETFMIQATALAQRIRSLPVGRQNIIIGISGGLDSTHAALVAAKTLDLLGLPRTNLIGITMPGYGTTNATYEDAKLLVKALGGTIEDISIKDICEASFRSVGYDTDKDGTQSLTFENTQAWTRKHLLFIRSGMVGGIVLGTGDLSELLQGWCTYGADHFSHYGVNAGVFKTLMQYLIRYVSEVEYAGKPEVQDLLNRISRRPYSPELKPPTKDGQIAQKTEDEIGPYEIHDFTGYWMLRFGFAPSRIVRMALHAFAGRYDLATIRHWQEKFLKRFFASQFKRSCLPDGPKVGLATVDPRGDWRMPSDAQVELWLTELRDGVPTETKS